MSIKLKKAFKEQWLAALRSGEYEQTKNVLHSVDDNGNNSFCCLGVACKLVAESKSSIIVTPFMGGVVQYNEDFMMPTLAVYNEMLTPESLEYIKKHDVSGVHVWQVKDVPVTQVLDGEGLPIMVDTYLPELNDTYRFTFEQIADIIEANF